CLGLPARESTNPLPAHADRGFGCECNPLRRVAGDDDYYADDYDNAGGRGGPGCANRAMGVDSGGPRSAPTIAAPMRREQERLLRRRSGFRWMRRLGMSDLLCFCDVELLETPCIAGVSLG